MKRAVNALRVPNVEPRGKSTTPNPSEGSITMNFKKKKSILKNGKLIIQTILQIGLGRM
jgi:hypothetical protein